MVIFKLDKYGRYRRYIWTLNPGTMVFIVHIDINTCRDSSMYTWLISIPWLCVHVPCYHSVSNYIWIIVLRGALMFALICVWLNGREQQSWGWWFETLSRTLWRHCNDWTHIHQGYFTSTRSQCQGSNLKACWQKNETDALRTMIKSQQTQVQQNSVYILWDARYFAIYLERFYQHRLT